MDIINNDELGFDSILSPEVVELLIDTNKTLNSEATLQTKPCELDEHEQALAG